MAFKDLTVKEWQEQISLALKYQKQNGRLEKWDTARKYYMNKYPENVISVNLVFAVGRALIPQLYFKTPTVVVQPNNEGSLEMAPVVEASDRQLIMKMGMKHQIKLGLLDAYTTNIAVFKFGYHSVATELPTQKIGTQTAITDLFKKDEETEDTVDENLSTYSYHDYVKPDTPWMLRVNPDDFLVPYGTLDKESAPWCAFRITRLVADVKNDPAYKNTESVVANTTLIENETGARATSPTIFKQVGGDEGNQNAVEFYEIWDKRTGKIIVIHPDMDKAWRDEKHGFPFEGLPVELIQFNPTGWDFWGVSDVEQIEQQQVEYNETRTLEIAHKRAAIAKFFVDEGMIDDTEITKFMQGKISVIKVKGNPNSAVKEMNPSMSRDLYNMSDVIRNDVGEILGFNRNQAGDFNVSRRTATEASIVQKAVEIRSDERRDLVADFIAAAFQRKINPLIFQQWTTKRSIEVSGKQGWVSFTGAQIKGDYNISIIADSVVPLTQAQKQQTASFVLDRFDGNPRVNQDRLYQWVFAQFENMGIPQDLLVDEEEFQKNIQQQLIQQLAVGKGGQSGQTQSPVSQVLQRQGG